jgi:uncharacterized protein YjiS (DUF1127 family)
MAFLTNAPRSASIDAGSRFAAMRARFGDWRARRAAYLRTYDELAACSDRELADLGLSRADIPALARRSADAV